MGFLNAFNRHHTTKSIFVIIIIVINFALGITGFTPDHETPFNLVKIRLFGNFYHFFFGFTVFYPPDVQTKAAKILSVGFDWVQLGVLSASYAFSNSLVGRQESVTLFLCGPV